MEALAPLILHTICENMEAKVAAFWLWRQETQELTCEFTECYDESPAMKEFCRVTNELHFVRGVGLPGRTIDRSEPVWLSSDYKSPSAPRTDAARKAGIVGAVGIPIKVGADLYGVIEFFTAEPLEPRPSLTNMFDVIGSEIGQFMFRKRVETEREGLLIREKQLRRQAEKASRLKDEFLATVSMNFGHRLTQYWVGRSFLRSESLMTRNPKVLSRPSIEMHADRPS